VVLRPPFVSPLRMLFLAAAVVTCACSSQHASEAVPAPARAPDRFIYVSAGDVPSTCYHDLGEVTFTEPFTDAAMDGEGVRTATKLRELAMAKYPDTADAVIMVRSQENEIGTTVTVTGEVVELQQGQHTVECAMRKAPGVINTAAAVAAGGMLGAVAGGLIVGSTTAAMAGGAIGVGGVGTYMGVEQHLQTRREQAKLKTQLETQQAQIAHLLAKRTSLKKCVDDEIPLAHCKINDTIAAANGPSHPADAPAYEKGQPQIEMQKKIQEQQGYIQKLSDQIFELQQQLGAYSFKTASPYP
jgi:hypothetical protein